MADEDRTYTAEEVEAKIAEANKAIERSRNEALADKRKARDDAESLKAKLDEMQAQFADLEQKAKATEVGISDEDLNKLRETIAADEARKTANLKTELDELRQSLEERDGKIRTLTLDNVVKGEMGKVGARADRIDALFKLTADRYELADDGEPILRENREVPLNTYIQDTLANEYPEFFNGTGSSGGGASRSTASGGGSARIIAAGDTDAFMSNVEGIARGEVIVE